MKNIYLLTIAFLLLGCAVGYQPYKTMSGGYKDEKIGENKYSIEYHIFAPAYANKLMGYWHQRASELCPNGYKTINVGRADTNTTSAMVSGGIVLPISSSEPRAIGEIECNKQ